MGGHKNSMWGEEMTPLFMDLNGNRIKRNPFSYPYSYDSYVTWKDENFDKTKCHTAYSDRLFMWNSEKFNKCCLEVFNNKSQQFDQREPKEIETFLSRYFEKEIKLKAILQGCNQSSGFPYWTFLYEDLK